ncbi:MAG: hypothetical protein LBQ78_00115 [Tannerellaceae bacterium]|jgi:hypothetical protein|nr:hypothetical protein [Tannerellaceae bacterium]
MDKKTTDTDWLGSLFSQLPEEELPASFHENMMRRIEAETVRAKKRGERIELFAVILASLVMIALAVCACLYMEIRLPAFDFSIAETGREYLSRPLVHFYLYIAVIALSLLLADWLFGRHYRRKE